MLRLLGTNHVSHRKHLCSVFLGGGTQAAQERTGNTHHALRKYSFECVDAMGHLETEQQDTCWMLITYMQTASLTSSLQTKTFLWPCITMSLCILSDHVNTETTWLESSGLDEGVMVLLHCGVFLVFFPWSLSFAELGEPVCSCGDIRYRLML